LERFDFFGSNPTGKFYGADFSQTDARNREARFQFRPSDIAIGTDGAIYVADWFDTRVGGHGAYDEKGVGSIYRITRKGSSMKAPKIDYSTTKGLMEAFKNPSHNVRGAAFYGLKGKGGSAVNPVAKLLEDDNPYFQARAVFLLPHLGPRGVELVEERLTHSDPQMRIAAFRALRSTGSNYMSHATKLARDASPAVRREVALALRDVPLGEMRETLLDIVDGYDGEDRWYLEAIGTSVALEESQAYAYLKSKRGGDPADWDNKFASIAWRLHPESAVADMKAYAMNTSKPIDSRVNMLTAIA
jgi:hypothetical protein